MGKNSNKRVLVNGNNPFIQFTQKDILIIIYLLMISIQLSSSIYQKVKLSRLINTLNRKWIKDERFPLTKICEWD